MNKTSARLCRNVSEIEFASLETLDSRLVKPKRLKESPINMECTLYKIIDLPGITEDNYNGILIGKVIGIHINDEYIKDGKVDVKKIKPLARLGYFDYSVIDDFFSIKRPK